MEPISLAKAGSAPAGASPSGGPRPGPKKTTSFQSVLESEMPAGISELENAVTRGGPIGPKELLVYQMKLNRFNIGIELASKVAESVMGTIRKFQG